MKVKDAQTGVEFDAEIELVSRQGFKTIKEDSERFPKFDWYLYKGKEVYELKLKNGNEILGLMCIIDHADPLTNAIEIELLEIAAENVGADKKIENIGGCLIAFACREAFKRDHDGFVFLIPKTKLVEHYIKYYGFEYFPMKTVERPEGFLFLHDHTSRKLIEKYLK